MRFHWQNLNERPDGTNGWAIRNGRAWWHVTERTQLSLEWGIKPKPELGASVSIGGIHEQHLTFHVTVLGFYMFLGVIAPIFAGLYRWCQRQDGVRSGVSLRWERTLQLRIDVASRDMSWRSGDRWWRKGKTIDFADLLFGRQQHSERVLRRAETVIPLPEGCYPATVELNLACWSRPRSPFKLRRFGAKVDIPGGIGFAGKGENSWDCGDDGTWGLYCSATTVEEAVAKVVQSVLTSRHRHGQASWLRDVKPVMAPKRLEPQAA